MSVQTDRMAVPSRAGDHTDGAALQGRATSLAAHALDREIAKASEFLRRIFCGFDGSLTLRLWNGTTLKLGTATHIAALPRFTLVLHRPSAIWALVLGRDPLRLVEAYFRGDIDIEGDFFAALELKDQLHSIVLSRRNRLAALITALQLPASSGTWSSAGPKSSSLRARTVKAHSRTENLDSISFHYDVSNDFYALWLDKAMVYSCAYFEQPGDDLDRAQRAKLDHICRKLLLQPGEHLLDIGCGWGALVIHAARHYGVRAHGITLSEHQLRRARERIAQAGLHDRVTVEVRDYRDLQGESIYDKISSIGMFEHVGLKNLPVYFGVVHRLLKPAGLFLNHGITSDEEGWTKTISTEFINRYVFPDGQLDTVSNIQRVMERAQFEIADVEALRPHYALTLRHWVSRLERHHTQALQYVSESTYRVWRLYMAACALHFEAGEIGVYQVLGSKRARSATLLPMTRHHMYP